MLCRATVLRLSALLVLLTACSPSVDPPDARPGDSSALDGPSSDTPIPPDAQRCTGNAECSNDVYCDGEERCVGGVCMPGRDPCEDGRSCTMDSCDEAARMCTNAPDDAMCGDTNACNGRERCNPGAPGALPSGCEPVREDNVIDCDDSNTCTIDACDQVAGCVHAPRDLDGDGFVDRTCTIDGTPVGPPGTDCNDGDPTVFPGAPEVCNDNRDNNCDGRTDYADPSCVPTNDACASATVLPGPGVYSASTVGLTNDYALACNAGSYADAVFQFTLTAPQMVTVSMSGSTTSNAALALVSSCASPLTETRCNRSASSSISPSFRVRRLEPGTYFILAETGTTASAFRLSLRYDPPMDTPPEELCPAGTATTPSFTLVSGVDRAAPLSTLDDDHLLSCNSFSARRDAVYRLDLTAPSDVLINARPTTATSSTTYLSFRDTPCSAPASERRCTSFFGAAGVTYTQRSLAAGSYWLVVENSTDSDVTVRATITTPPAPRDPNDACPLTEPGTTPVLTSGVPVAVNYTTSLEDDYVLSCNSTTAIRRDAVYRLNLAAPSDVLLTATSSTGTNYVSLRGSPCATSAAERRCLSGFGATGVTMTQRALPAGNYWVIVENSSDSPTTLTATITTPPAVPAAGDLCPATAASPVLDLMSGVPRVVTLSGFTDDHTLSCLSGSRRDAVLRIVKPTAGPITVTATASLSSIYMALRNSPCEVTTSDRVCRFLSSSGSISEPAVPAGTYWVIVEHTSDQPVTVTATF